MPDSVTIDSAENVQESGDCLSDLLSVGLSFHQSFALIAAFKHGLIDALAAGKATRAELERIAGPKSARAVGVIMQSLTCAGVVHPVGACDGAAGYYCLTDAFAGLADPESREAASAIMRLIDRRFIPMWSSLERLAETGMPVSEAVATGSLYQGMYRTSEKVWEFARAMRGFSDLIGRQLAERWTAPSGATFLDLGGGDGACLFRLLERNNEAQGTVVDLAPLKPVFEAARDRAPHHVARRADFVVGSFFERIERRADVVILGQILHNWSPAERRQILGGAFDILNPGGTLIVYDPLVGWDGHSKRDADLAAFFDSQMRCATLEGSGYSVGDAEAWMRAAGFRPVGTIPLFGPFLAIRAVKN